MTVTNAPFLSMGYLQDYVSRITERSGSAWVCPLCGSGTGKHRTGAFSLYKENGKDKWKCFACNETGDLFDLIGKVEGISGGYNEQLRRAGEIFGVDAFTMGRSKPDIDTQAHTDNSIHTSTYTAYFEEANKRLGETDYHRGISLETLNRFRVGYDPKWRLPLQVYLASDKPLANGKPRTKESWERLPTTPRLIIPTSETSYLARDTRKDIPEAQRAYEKSKVGKVCLFNAEVLFTATSPVFITEGELDALSIIDCGAEACALGSIANARKLVGLFDERKPSAKIILALDDDAQGRKATDILKQELLKRDIPFGEWVPVAGFKDANAMLEAGERGFLETAINDALMVAGNKEAAEQEEKEAYIHSSAYDFLQPLYDKINASVDTPFFPTNFPLLDKVFDGGLYEGLYILGAISSLGKTTFMLQIADQIAEAGEADILYFSLEMSRFEMMAKSISRHTAILSSARYGGSLEYAKTVRGITTGRFWYGYDDEQKKLIYEAMSNYGSYAHRIYHLEGLGDIGTKQIREAVERHIKMTGRAPVVFVDYLQIVAPVSDRLTDKQATDKNVLELKKISRDFKVPVFTVSSFNRMNYASEVKMEAFKESGAIEYSADVLLGLQLEGAGDRDFDATKEKAKLPRQIELLVLKNRNGAVGATLKYDYDPRFNLFEEKGSVTPSLYGNMKVHGKTYTPGKPYKDWDTAPQDDDEDWDVDLQRESLEQASLVGQEQAGKAPMKKRRK